MVSVVFPGKDQPWSHTIPDTLTTAHIMTSCPRSVDITAPDCFVPFEVTCFGKYKSDAKKVVSVHHFGKFVKEDSYIVAIKTVCRDILVDSGFTSERLGRKEIFYLTKHSTHF